MPNWSEVLQEISNLDAQIKSQSAVDLVRRNHLNNLFEKTGRNVIAYYSGWLSKPGIEGDIFVARLRDMTADEVYPGEIAEFPVGDVSEDDRELFRVGAVFYIITFGPTAAANVSGAWCSVVCRAGRHPPWSAPGNARVV